MTAFADYGYWIIWMLISAPFGMLGLLLLFAACYHFCERVALTLFGERVTAEILGIRQSDSGDSTIDEEGHSQAGTSRKLRVRFSDVIGRTHKLLVDEWPGAKRDMAAGTVELVYSRQRPKKAFFVNRWWPKWGGAIVFSLLGAILLIGPVVGAAHLYPPLGSFLAGHLRPLFPHVMRWLPLSIGAMFTAIGLSLGRRN